MPKDYEPDSQFVDRLEWQLASEFRRREHLKPAPGRIAVPRSVAALSVAAGILLLGVAATKAADLIKDSWRKKIEVARLETEVKIKTAFLELKKEWSAQTENKCALGLISNEETLTAKSASQEAAAELERAILDLEEVKASGEAPRNELYAPLVGGRDFVSERLEIEKKRGSSPWTCAGTASSPPCAIESNWDSCRRVTSTTYLAWLSVDEAGIGTSRTGWPCGGGSSPGEISAGELEIQTRMSAAEKNLREAQSEIDTVGTGLEDLRAKEAVGLIPNRRRQGHAALIGRCPGQGRPGPPGDRDPEDDPLEALPSSRGHVPQGHVPATAATSSDPERESSAFPAYVRPNSCRIRR